MALPYIDSELDARTKASVLELIEREIELSGGRAVLEAQYLAKLPPLPYSINTAMQPPKSMDVIDLKRYELNTTEQQQYIAFVVLEYEERRRQNLQVMSIYGTDAARDYAKRLHVETTKAELEAVNLKQQCDLVNLERKTTQQAAGLELQTMHKEWKSTSAKKRVIMQALLLQKRLKNEI